MDAVLDDVFLDMRVRWEVSDFIDDCTEQLTLHATKLDLFVEGQRRGIPTTPVNTVADLHGDPHLRSAGFWREEQHPTLGTIDDAGRAVPGQPRLVALGLRAGARRRTPLRCCQTSEPLGRARTASSSGDGVGWRTPSSVRNGAAVPILTFADAGVHTATARRWGTALRRPRHRLAQT